MSSITPEYLARFSFHPSTVRFMNECAEAKGKQDLWQKTRPEVLKTLQDSAIIQSAESSNRIEGVEVEKHRLVPLVLGQVKPQDRNEEEIIGYRKALTYIQKNFKELTINVETIKKLQQLAQDGQMAAETEKAIEQLCLGYRYLIDQSKFPDLFLVAVFIFDFLCIHPFRDGNGRVSRLLTLLLLYQNNYLVGRYISLERLIELAKNDYYLVLKNSSENWHESKHDLMPWVNYFVSILREAYKELSFRVENTQLPDNKSGVVKQVLAEFPGKFRLSDVSALVPEISEDLIKKILSELKEKGEYKLEGRGPGAFWKKVKLGD